RLMIPVIKGAPRELLTKAFDRAAAAVGRPRVAVRVQSDLPISVGLGSSAALSVACAKVLIAASGSKKSVESVALEMEKIFHGTPSGVDHTTSARGALIHFKKGRVRLIRARKPMKLLVALVGVRGPTAKTVGELRARQELW